MKAELVKAKGMDGEYFCIKLYGVEMECKDCNGFPVILQLPASHYDMMRDPEKVLSNIVKAINIY